uniref:Protein white n=1 Tax=Hirondellea gigas TaxID=1518452 RepID=A0A6A7G0X1_9CRUS
MSSSASYSNPAYKHDSFDKVVDVDPESGNPAGDDLFHPITYSWLGVNVFAEKKAGLCSKKENVTVKHILKNVSGICKPGELLAIMGASGAGKTTLLNVLTGRGGDNLRVTGSLHVNGCAIRPHQLTSRSAYVQQDDLFVGTLTVKEQLIFQARLRMDRQIPQSERMKRVQQVMLELSLVRCQNTLIGVTGRIKGISGGETKRLAFACEMLTNPPLMFCDEPTSGLDSFMAQTMVEAMQKMAQQGRTIICTIHQPSSEVFALFDRVLLMAEGRVAFLGLTTDAIDFFARSDQICPSNYNPADFFIMTLAVHPEHEEDSRSYIQSLCDKYDAGVGKGVYRQAEQNAKCGRTASVFDDYKENSSPYKASWGSQFLAVFVRSGLQIIREPLQLRIKLMQTTMTALLLGLIYLDQNYDQKGVSNMSGALFLLITNLTFQNVFGVVNVFCTEMEILKREHYNGMYRSEVFFLAKNIAEIPLAVLQPMLFVCVIYYMVGLNPAVEHFFICMGILVLVANIAVSFGYFISCMSKNVEMALAISAPLIIPFMLFGGFFLNSDSVPVYFIWLQYISWFNYANEALTINQWNDIEHIDCSNTTRPDNCLNNGQDVLDSYNFEAVTIIMTDSDHLNIILIISN